MEILTFCEFCRQQADNQATGRVDELNSDWKDGFGLFSGVKNALGFGKKPQLQPKPMGTPKSQADMDQEKEMDDVAYSHLSLPGRDINRKARQRAGKAAMNDRGLNGPAMSSAAKDFEAKYGPHAQMPGSMWPSEMRHHFDALGIEDQNRIAPHAIDPAMSKSRVHARRPMLDRGLEARGIDDPVARRRMAKNVEGEEVAGNYLSPEEHERWRSSIDRKVGRLGMKDGSEQKAVDKNLSADRLAFIDKFVKNYASNFGHSDVELDGKHAYNTHPDVVNQALKARGYSPLRPEELQMFSEPDHGRGGAESLRSKGPVPPAFETSTSIPPAARRATTRTRTRRGT